MILPPLLLVFSTESAVLRPCSCFPSPWPSLKPYFCMILWATVPLQKEKTHQLVKVSYNNIVIAFLQYVQVLKSCSHFSKHIQSSSSTASHTSCQGPFSPVSDLCQRLVSKAWEKRQMWNHLLPTSDHIILPIVLVCIRSKACGLASSSYDKPGCPQC